MATLVLMIQKTSPTSLPWGHRVSEQVFVNHLLNDSGMSMFGEYSVDHLCSRKALKNVNDNSALILKGNICTIRSF